jgi:nucleotide-binding universal stress UspA family protein
MRRILVALDRSITSNVVLHRAVELARETGAKLRLMRALPAEGSADGTVDAEASLRELENDVPEGLRDGVVVERGSAGAAAAICKVAKSYDADVVVLGAHRSSVLHRALGSTTARVVNDIDRPVFVVRSRTTLSPEAGAEAARFRGHDQHPVLEAATMTGAASGAVVGALGGVPGIVAGSMIGTALGLLTGEGLEKVATRGSPPAATAMLAGAMLHREHERLEGIYANLLSAYRNGEWSDVRAQWSIFEPALRTHMEIEERDALPAFRALDAKEADALLAENATLRALLGTIGVNIELHAAPQRDAEALVAILRSHGAREDRLFYAWMDSSGSSQSSAARPGS